MFLLFWCWWSDCFVAKHLLRNLLLHYSCSVGGNTELGGWWGGHIPDRDSTGGGKPATIAKGRSSVGRRGSASRNNRKAISSAKRAIRKLRKQERAWRPKRAIGPYMFFCKDQHANVTADNPSIPFTEIGKILGAQWQQMNEKDKKPYIKRSEVDKKRYEKELKRCKLKWCTTKWRATSEAANYPRSFKNLPVNILLRITDVKEQLFGEEKNYNWIFSSDPRL